MSVIDPIPYRNDNNTALYIHVLSMRRGDTILIMVPNGDDEEIEYKHILIDLAEAKIIQIQEYLRHFNVNHLEALIITHPHDDHSYDIQKFYDEMQINDIWLTEFHISKRSGSDYKKFINSFKSNSSTLKSFFKPRDMELIYNCNGNPIIIKLEWPSSQYRDSQMRTIFPPQEETLFGALQLREI